MNKKESIIILHGWGLRGSLYKQLAYLMEQEKHTVYYLDLPGFGNEPLKKMSMMLDDYVDFVHDFIKEKKILNVVFIGHSFGGRIALKYSWRYPKEVTKLILTGVPVIRNKAFIKKIVSVIAIIGNKTLSNFPKNIYNFFSKSLYFVIGEFGYYKAGVLKETFRNIIKEDLFIYAKEVNVPVILVWGENDAITPVSDVNKIQKIIKGSKTVIIPNEGHKLPYENPKAFFEAIKSFI